MMKRKIWRVGLQIILNCFHFHQVKVVEVKLLSLSTSLLSMGR